MNTIDFYNLGLEGVPKGIVEVSVLENIKLDNFISLPRVLKNNGVGVHGELGVGYFKTPKINFLKDKTAILEYEIKLYKSDFVESFDWEFEYQNKDILDVFLYNSITYCNIFHFPQLSTWFCDVLSHKSYDSTGRIIGSRNHITQESQVSFTVMPFHHNEGDFQIVDKKNIKRISGRSYERQTYKMEGDFTVRDVGLQPYQILIHFIFIEDL